MTTAAAAAGTSTPRNEFTFECIICLEALDQPTSVNVSDLQGGQGDVGSVRARGGARAARTRALQDLSRETIVATHCGHLYHQMCIEKWFIENGRRTCRSCRKIVPKAKLIRVYPASSDAPGLPDLANNPGPSTSRNTETIADVASAVRVAMQPGPIVIDDDNDEPDGECTEGECQDAELLHNTLMTHFNEYQTDYNAMGEASELREALNLSLVGESSWLHEENDRLKRQLNEMNVSPGPSTSS